MRSTFRFIPSRASSLSHCTGLRNRHEDIRSPDGVDAIHSELAISGEGFGAPLTVVYYPLLATLPGHPECNSPCNVAGISHNSRTGDDRTQDLAGRARFSGMAWKTLRFSMVLHSPQLRCLTALCHTIEHVRGKRILELGCGAGYLGLVVAAIQLNAAELENPEPSVWLTDVNDVVLSRCRENLNLPCSALWIFLVHLNAVSRWQMRRPGTNTYISGSWIGSQHYTWTASLPYVI